MYIYNHQNNVKDNNQREKLGLKISETRTKAIKLEIKRNWTGKRA